MATLDQKNYIIDLAVQKTREYKEIKELLLASGIVGIDSQTVLNAQSLSAILDAMTDHQASRLIDALIARPVPSRGKRYTDKRIKTVMNLLEEIKADIDNWTFQS